MAENRTTNSIKNLLTGLVGQVLLIIVSFVTRTVFTRTLGPDYLGLNGLFSNIISLLTLTELGVGSAIMYTLYKPIAEKDQHRIYLLMKFYKTAYRIIGTVVTVTGLLLLPFLSSLIKGPPTFINYYFIFILYLLQTASTYFFFAYKASLLQANQKMYVVTVIGYVFTIVSSILQCAGLWLWKDYYLYLIIVIATNILQNFAVARKSDRLYPFVNKSSKECLDRAEVKTILKNCFALSIYKINNVVVTATDNMVLSSLIGLPIVGVYSNYTLVTNSIKKIINTIFTSLSASIGNLHASEEETAEKKKDVFFATDFVAFYLNGITAIAFFCCINLFMELWLGKDYLLSQLFVLILCVNYYLTGIQTVTNVFRSSMGLFQQAKYRPLVGAVLNVVLSIVLVFPMGINGVLLATVLSGLLTYSWFDPLIIFRHGFGCGPGQYYKKHLIYFAVVGLTGGVNYWLVGILPLSGVVDFLISGILSLLLPGLCFILIFWRTKEMRMLRRQAWTVLRKTKKSKI